MHAQQSQSWPVGARARRRLELRRAGRRSLGLTALAIIPGAGLIPTRYRRFGWLLLGLSVAAVVVGVIALAVNGALSTALTIAVRPDLLLVIAALAIVVALVWMLSIVLTNRGTEPERADASTRIGLRIFTGLMCLLVAIPALQVVRYSMIQRDVVSTVFTTEGGGGTVAGNAVTARPDEAAADPWKDVDRVNMLLIGSDAGDDREGVRTDSMVVASIDPQTGNTALVSIPRNLQHAPFPESNPLHAQYPNGYYCPDATAGNECLINAVWELALENKSLFKNDPNPGLTTIRDVIGEVTGLPINYSTVIDLAGFSQLVDAMGGVTVNVTERLPIQGYHTSSGGVAGIQEYIETGTQKLDGFHALWFARSRLLSDDYSRMKRQRCLIGAILDQVNPVTMLGKYPALAQVAKENITTDVKVSDLPAWVELVQRIQKGSIHSVAFTEEVINPSNPNFEKMRTLVQQAITEPPATSTATPTPAPTAGSTPAASATTGSSTTSTPSGTATSSSSIVDVRDAC